MPDLFANPTEMHRQGAAVCAVCADCRFFHEHNAASGDCHRYPPVFAGNDTPNERHRWKHPLVPHNNWCGEFQIR